MFRRSYSAVLKRSLPAEPGMCWGMDTVTGPNTVDHIHAALQRFWAAHNDLPCQARMHLEIAVAEVAANIVEHAAKDGPVRLKMSVRCFPNQVQIDFNDNGASADIDLSAVHMPNELVERGRGLALARSGVRRLHYHRNCRGNHWTLISEPFDWIGREVQAA